MVRKDDAAFKQSIDNTLRGMMNQPVALQHARRLAFDQTIETCRAVGLFG
jgi:hypothetical protein